MILQQLWLAIVIHFNTHGNYYWKESAMDRIGFATTEPMDSKCGVRQDVF